MPIHFTLRVPYENIPHVNAIHSSELLLKSTGELLRMTHVARGLDSDGSLLLDVVISGHILQLQSTDDVNVKVSQAITAIVAINY